MVNLIRASVVLLLTLIVASTVSITPATAFNYSSASATVVSGDNNDAYSVTVVDYRPGRFATVKATTTGFAPGSWSLLWVTGPDGDTYVNGDGAPLDEYGNVWLIPNVTYPSGTEYSVQVSVGAWPDERWSQPVMLHA